MRSMLLRLVALLLHAWVGWRIAPALASSAAAVVFVVLLAISALTLPFGFGARRAGTKGRLERTLAWTGLIGMGLFSSLFVLTLLRDIALLALAAVAWA